MLGAAAASGPGPLRGFLAWWARNLAAWLPASARDTPPGGSDALLARVDGGEIHLSARRRGEPVPLATIGAGRKEETAIETATAGLPRGLPVLVQADAAVLRKRLELPLGARADLARLLAFEIDRETPFTAEEVYWTFADLTAPRGAERLSVELLVVPRDTVTPALEALRAAGREPSGIETPAVAGRRTVIPLGQGAARTRRPFGRRLMRTLAVVLVIDVLALMILPPARQVSELRSLEAAVEAKRAQAVLAARLREQVAGHAAPRELADDTRLDPFSVLGLLAAVTAALPDGAYLDSLAVQDGRLSLRGRAQSAAQVIVALGAEPMVADLVLAAPITLAEGGDREQFDVMLRIRRGEMLP